MSISIPSNINPSQLGNLTNNIPRSPLSSTPRLQVTPPNTKTLLEKSKAQFDKVREEANSKNPLRNTSNPKGFLQNQNNLSPTQALTGLIGIVTPLLIQFINAEKSANIIINKLINDTRKKLQDKGRVVVTNGTINFTPKNPGNYEVFKKNFESKVNRLKRIVTILQKIINSLVTLLRVVRNALAIFQASSLLKKRQLQVESVASAVELASPSPSKPTTGKYIVSDRISEDALKPLQDKITQYTLMVDVITSILQLFKRMLDSLSIKLNTLNFIIDNVTDGSSEELKKSLNESTLEGIEEIYDNGVRTYKIRIITTPSGAIQAVAFDAFSGLKITQTSPSKSLTPDQLLEELKQILG